MTQNFTEVDIEVGGLSTVKFPVRSNSALLFIKTTGQVSFYRSVEGGEETEFEKKLDVSVKANETLINMTPRSYMRIVSTATIEKCIIEWSE